jgi:hypothetical protein
MSDFKNLREIISNGPTSGQKKTQDPFAPVKGSTVPPKPEAQPGDRWIRTKFCWCPPNADSDCRFHSTKEPGWETCPYEFKQGKDTGRWLWVSRGTPVSEKELSQGADLKDLSNRQQKAADSYVGGEIEPLTEEEKVARRETQQRNRRVTDLDLNEEE